jgi:acetyl/propionyl-CoA carboxylase alpha subunit
MLLTDAGDFFFLEMNTRLQVEHPVTEAVTGRDLVADQLRIASGATLRELGLDRPSAARGHAIEARVYAEDPEAGFLPATGSLALVRWPEGVRVDTGVTEGDRVNERYDPMLAKLIASGPTRAAALESLAAALDSTCLLGVRTNLRFLRWLVRQPPIVAGEVRTDTIGLLELQAIPEPDDIHWRAAALLLEPPGGGPWSGGWRLNGRAVRRVRHGEIERSVGQPEEPGLGPAAAREGEVAHVDVDGQSLEFRLASPPTVEEAVRHATAAGGDGRASLVAPMPGRVVSVRARPGAAVDAHAAIVVIEAMKMEHAVVAPIDGVLASVLVDEGQQVQRGDLLAEVAPMPEPHTGDQS